MSLALLLSAVLLASTASFDPTVDSNNDEEITRTEEFSESMAKEFLISLNEETRRKANELVTYDWAYTANITKENFEKKVKVTAHSSKRNNELWEKMTKFNWRTFKDPDVKRQFKKFSAIRPVTIPYRQHREFKTVVSEMSNIYAKAEICSYKNTSKCDLKFDPDIIVIMARSRDEKELRHAWIEWHKASGQKCRKMWERYVYLSNEAAKLKEFSDKAEYWLFNYETADFTDQIEKLWKQLRPLYMQLHAYVRRQLREKYGTDIVTKRGPIPAHLLGNMWAQIWTSIYDFTVPFPGKTKIDVTYQMVKQGYTADKMFRITEEFFTSLNLSKMPDMFWEKSILQKPNDGRDLICHPSSWNFYDSKDVRIIMCSVGSMQNLLVAHHEMGHLQYYLQYKDQPYIYRSGANPGFHEAIGDVMALSVSTPQHLKKIGLITGDVKPGGNYEDTINFLYLQGLSKIAMLPYAFLLDKYRWNVFKGKTLSTHYNCDYWRLRHHFQGVEPPVDRSEEDFDAGSKYHVVSDVPFIRYFVSLVIQFQFHRALCIKAGQFDPEHPDLKPLHECDIYQSTEAGNALGKMLQMGSSKPWPDAMEAITGQREMDASVLLEYFQPLRKWLEENNKKHKQFIGWESPRKRCRRKKMFNIPKPTPAINSV